MLGKLNHSKNSFYHSVKMLEFSIDHSSVKCIKVFPPSDLTGKSGSMNIGVFSGTIHFSHGITL